MPSFDSSRARFRLADRHIAVFAHLVDGQTPPEELTPSLTELQRVGLVGEEGELAPLLGDLLRTLADPVMMIQVEITGAHGPLNHGVVVGQDAVIAHDGWPGEEESEYVSIEPNTLVWELARKVNLHRGERPEEGAPEVRVGTTMAALDAAFVALEEPGPDDDATRDLVRTALVEADPALADRDQELTTLRDLIVSLNATWRITTSWDGEHEGERAAMVRALAVWDCGPLGHWIREQPEEPILPGQVGPESPLVLVRSHAAEVWRKITALIPDREELVGSGSTA
ncbi:hypothetical protein ACFQ9U_22630 [Streptomyces sp. NPDC056568]|uniref:hypothetical protein n=1 Tax=Streptomyces sp. NPDC056568 TaxID=3345866 RepID=UPI00367464FE